MLMQSRSYEELKHVNKEVRSKMRCERHMDITKIIRKGKENVTNDENHKVRKNFRQDFRNLTNMTGPDEGGTYMIPCWMK